MLNIKKILIVGLFNMIILSGCSGENSNNSLPSDSIIAPVNLQVIGKDNYLLFEKVLYTTKDPFKLGRYFLVKNINSDGVSENTKKLNNIDLFNISKFYKVGKQRYIVVGYEQDLSKKTTHQATIMLINDKSEILWRTVIGDNKSYAHAMVANDNNEYLVVGDDFTWTTKDKSRGHYKLMLSKVDSKGNKLWAKYFSIDNNNAKGLDIIKTKDGDYIIVGKARDKLNNKKAWILRVDSNGNKKWENFFANPDAFDTAYYIGEDKKNGYIVTGTSAYSGEKGDEIWALKINNIGKIEWNSILPIKKLSSLQSIIPQSIKRIEDKYVLAGIYIDRMVDYSLFFLETDLNRKKRLEKIIKIDD